LYQKDVAAQIGVTTSSIWNWEHGWSITLRCMPKIIKFLGYNPIACPDGIIERLAWYKLINGLSFDELGNEMRRDPEQLADWLAGRHNPCQHNLKAIEVFLSDHVHGPGAVQQSGAVLPDESAAVKGPIKSLTEITTSEKDAGT